MSTALLTEPWRTHLRPNNWPKTADLGKQFGKIELDRCGLPTERFIRRSLIRMAVPFALRPASEPEFLIRFVLVNRNCRDSLSRIMASIALLYEGSEVIANESINIFGGSFIPPSYRLDGDFVAHQWGAAINLGGTTPEIQEIFRLESWRCIGKDKRTFVATK